MASIGIKIAEVPFVHVYVQSYSGEAFLVRKLVYINGLSVHDLCYLLFPENKHFAPCRHCAITVLFRCIFGALLVPCILLLYYIRHLIKIPIETLALVFYCTFCKAADSCIY